MYPTLPGDVFMEDASGKRFVLWRDKDMPAALMRRQDAIGFLGSDTFDELSQEQQSQLEFIPAIETDIRFALSALTSRATAVCQTIATGEGLTIATSYPNRTRYIAGELGFQLTEIIELGGSVEAAPYVLEQVDAIVDVVDSGRTLKENNLSIIVDNLGQLAIGAIWKK
jgi:ATP phosphoribosyltransferase